MLLPFEEKIACLALIRTLGLAKATNIYSSYKKLSTTVVRDYLDKLDSTHYLLNNGVVEKTATGTIQYVKFSSPQQPSIITKEYFDQCKLELQDEIAEALAVLNITHLLRTFRPTPITKKMKYEQIKEWHQKQQQFKVA